MKEKLRAKLRSSAGESIAETLISVLISGLALLILAGAVSSAANIVKRSNAAINAYYTQNAENVKSAGLSGGGGDGTTEFRLGSYSLKAAGLKRATYYENSRLSETPVILYTAEIEGGGTE